MEFDVTYTKSNGDHTFTHTLFCNRDIVSIFDLIKHVYTKIADSGFKRACLSTDGAFIQITSDNWFYFEMFGMEMFGAQGRLTFAGKLSEI